MSQRPSACVPPPTDYAPRPRPPKASKYQDRHDRDGRNRSRGRRDHQPVTFHRDSTRQDNEPLKQVKPQPKDRFYRNDDDDYFARVQDEEEEMVSEEADRGESDEQSTRVDRNSANDIDEEDDPLDAYMKSLGADAETTEAKSASPSHLDVSQGPDTTNLESERAKGVRLDIDDSEDIEESYYKYVEEKKSQSDNQEEDERQDLIEYDQEGNIISVRKIKREVEPLPHFDHSTVKYEPFDRFLYQEHEEIAKLTSEQSDELRRKLEIKVSSNSVPKPVCSFAHFKFDEKLMKVIRRSDYFQPTPIQAQAIPAALSGRNIIGIAVTGSGKTAAYIWPMIVHILRQPDLKKGDGPIGLILVPTRELAQQVYNEARKFSNSYKIKVICAYGGGSKYEQARDLELGSEIVVATPGRLIDLIKSNATNLRRVTYLVLDEADTFFKMGFEAQVRSICDHVRPDRQTLLFSATFKQEVEQLARTVTDDPVKIIQKTLGEANEDVAQHIVVLPSANKKWEWLTNRLVEFTSAGSVLIFVTRIVNCSELYDNLKANGKDALLLHGDMEQAERNRVITAFKRKDCDIMVATDVAARGLDIAHIRTVINYDVARDIDTHIHRVGRTGRAGLKGDAYTLLSLDKDKEFAGQLVRNLESSNQKISEDLMRLAMQSHNFRKTRDRHSRRDRRGPDSGHSHPHRGGSRLYNQYDYGGRSSEHRGHPGSSDRYPDQGRGSMPHHSSSSHHDRPSAHRHRDHERHLGERYSEREDDRKRSKWH